MIFSSHDRFQNTFVYQPTFTTIKYKNTRTEYVFSSKSKGVYNSKLTALNSDFLPDIKYFNNKRGLQFNNTPFVAEQNKFTWSVI